MSLDAPVVMRSVDHVKYYRKRSFLFDEAHIVLTAV